MAASVSEPSNFRSFRINVSKIYNLYHFSCKYVIYMIYLYQNFKINKGIDQFYLFLPLNFRSVLFFPLNFYLI